MRIHYLCVFLLCSTAAFAQTSSEKKATAKIPEAETNKVASLSVRKVEIGERSRYPLQRFPMVELAARETTVMFAKAKTAGRWGTELDERRKRGIYCAGRGVGDLKLG